MNVAETVGKHPTEIIGGFAASTLALLVAFGVPLDEKQIVAILGFIGTGIPVITLISLSRKKEA